MNNNGQHPCCWAPSTALKALERGMNNAPCILTDSPAEFNDTPLYRDPAGTIADLKRENAELRETLAAIRALDITELRDLLLILRRRIGGAMWSLDDEEEGLAMRTEKAIAALATYRKHGGE